RTASTVRGRCRSLLRPIRRARCGGHFRGGQTRRRYGPRHVQQGEAERRDRSPTGRRSRSDCRYLGPAAPLGKERGDGGTAFASAPVKLDQTYVTPTETHNPIELQATTAIWDRSMLTIYEESQGIFNLQGVLAQMFGLPKENVRVITKFVGSGFGSKLWPWTHCALAVLAARQLGKPVKLVISRKMMFQTVGHRPRVQQRVRLGATPDGKLVSLQQDYVNVQAILDNY